MEDLGLFIESSLQQSEEELISLKQKIKTEADHVRSIQNQLEKLIMAKEPVDQNSRYFNNLMNL